jgi:hypothetical protein
VEIWIQSQKHDNLLNGLYSLAGSQICVCFVTTIADGDVFQNYRIVKIYFTVERHASWNNREARRFVMGKPEQQTGISSNYIMCEAEELQKLCVTGSAD